MQTAPIRYRSADEDSSRWDSIALRAGDVVVSTRSKHGTTWVQLVCLMTFSGTAELPAPLAALSPWVDHRVEPVEDLAARLERLPGPRVLKTHTPLDGVPQHPGVRYVVVARHPLDAAVSLYHQGANIDRDRLAALTGSPAAERVGTRPDVHDWLRGWIDREADPREALDSLPGVLHHLREAWDRRDRDDVLLVHYRDLQHDLEREMRRVASFVGAEPPEETWPQLVAAAGFDAMSARAGQLVPDAHGVLRDATAFFRAGVSGTGSALLGADDLARYHRRVAATVPPDLATWLHRPEGRAAPASVEGA